MYEAFNARDVERFTAFCDPSIEFHSAFSTVFGGVYVGHDGVRTFFEDVAEAWDEWSAEPNAYFAIGEQTIASIQLHWRGRQSGVEVTTQIAQVVRWRDGLIVYMRTYANRDDALRDLGVPEDALEPIAPRPPPRA
jgi:ketosteroid isomerase-like protein